MEINKYIFLNYNLQRPSTEMRQLPLRLLLQSELPARGLAQPQAGVSVSVENCAAHCSGCGSNAFEDHPETEQRRRIRKGFLHGQVVPSFQRSDVPYVYNMIKLKKSKLM